MATPVGEAPADTDAVVTAIADDAAAAGSAAARAAGRRRRRRGLDRCRRAATGDASPALLGCRCALGEAPAAGDIGTAVVTTPATCAARVGGGRAGGRGGPAAAEALNIDDCGNGGGGGRPVVSRARASPVAHRVADATVDGTTASGDGRHGTAEVAAPPPRELRPPVVHRAAMVVVDTVTAVQAATPGGPQKAGALTKSTIAAAGDHDRAAAAFGQCGGCQQSLAAPAPACGDGGAGVVPAAVTEWRVSPLWQHPPRRVRSVRAAATTADVGAVGSAWRRWRRAG